MNALAAKRLAIVTTLRCTLRCKLCSNHMTKFINPQDVALKEIQQDIDHVFELFHYIDWIQFVGGEIFLHKDMAEVFLYTLKYGAQFGKLTIMTNATLALRPNEIDIIKQYGEKCQFLISDYGKYSYKINEVKDALNKAGVPFVLKKYYGEDQHFGGWIDNSIIKDSGESDEIIAERAAKCPQVKIENMHCLTGKLHRCSNSAFMSALGKVIPAERDFVNLNDDSLSLDEKRKIVDDFYKYPRASCRYCVWSNADTGKMKRFPAAEQIN
jgi:organic radical activating enzyme